MRKNNNGTGFSKFIKMVLIIAVAVFLFSKASEFLTTIGNTEKEEDNSILNDKENIIDDTDDSTDDTNTKNKEQKLIKKLKDQQISLTKQYYKIYPIELTKPVNIKYDWNASSLLKYSAEFRTDKIVLEDALKELQYLERIYIESWQQNQNPVPDIKYQQYQSKKINIKLYDVIKDEWVSDEDFWSAVYRIIYNDNKERIKNISNIFKNYRANNNISKTQTIDILVSFVQNLKYKIPDNYYQIYPPLNSIFYNEADCDTRSLLLVMILKELGYDAIVLYSSKYLHAICAVDVGGVGDCITYRNKDYSLIETTATGWLVGMLPPEFNDLRYWYPISF